MKIKKEEIGMEKVGETVRGRQIEAARRILRNEKFLAMDSEKQSAVLKTLVEKGLPAEDLESLISETRKENLLMRLPYDVFVDLVERQNISGRSLIALCNTSTQVRDFCNASRVVNKVEHKQYLFRRLLEKMRITDLRGYNPRDLYVKLTIRGDWTTDLTSAKLADGSTFKHAARWLANSQFALHNIPSGQLIFIPTDRAIERYLEFNGIISLTAEDEERESEIMDALDDPAIGIIADYNIPRMETIKPESKLPYLYTATTYTGINIALRLLADENGGESSDEEAEDLSHLQYLIINMNWNAGGEDRASVEALDDAISEYSGGRNSLINRLGPRTYIEKPTANPNIIAIDVVIDHDGDVDIVEGEEESPRHKALREESERLKRLEERTKVANSSLYEILRRRNFFEAENPYRGADFQTFQAETLIADLFINKQFLNLDSATRIQLLDEIKERYDMEDTRAIAIVQGITSDPKSFTLDYKNEEERNRIEAKIAREERYRQMNVDTGYYRSAVNYLEELLAEYSFTRRLYVNAPDREKKIQDLQRDIAQRFATSRILRNETAENKNALWKILTHGFAANFSR